jgi:hypothetical protein
MRFAWDSTGPVLQKSFAELALEYFARWSRLKRGALG